MRLDAREIIIYKCHVAGSNWFDRAQVRDGLLTLLRLFETVRRRFAANLQKPAKYGRILQVFCRLLQLRLVDWNGCAPSLDSEPWQAPGSSADPDEDGPAHHWIRMPRQKLIGLLGPRIPPHALLMSSIQITLGNTFRGGLEPSCLRGERGHWPDHPRDMQMFSRLRQMALTLHW